MLKMLDKNKLTALLDQDKFKWVNQELLPIFGLLNVGKLIKDDFHKFLEYKLFTLPLSKENLIQILYSRNRDKHLTIIESELREFEESFKEYIEIKQDTFTYHARYSKKDHPPSNRWSLNPTYSTTYYTLNTHLDRLSSSILGNKNFDIDDIYNSMILKIRVVEDLIFILIIIDITETNLRKKPYLFEYHTEKKLKILLEIAKIDDEIIEYYLGYSAPERFSLDADKLFKFLPSNYKFLAYVYSHYFNTNSCYRWTSIFMNQSVSNGLCEKLNKLSIIEILSNSFKEIKNIIRVDDKRLPLYNYRHHGFKFIAKYRNALKNQFSPMYDFDIRTDEQEGLNFLIEKRIISIQDGKIVLLSEERMNDLHDSLERDENERISRNKREILTRWLEKRVRIESFKTGKTRKKPTGPKPPPSIEHPVSVLPPELPELHELEFYMGKTEGNKDIFWKPGELNNGFFLIAGTSGSGKTYTIKHIIEKISEQNFPILLIDFHGDMVGDLNIGINEYDVTLQSKYYFNPLKLSSKIKGEFPALVRDSFIEALGFYFPNIGISQKNLLKDLIQTVYDNNGITSDKNTWDTDFEFNEVFEIIENNKKEYNTIFKYIRPIKDYNLFSGKKSVLIPDLFEGSHHFKLLKGIPDDCKKLYSFLLLKKIISFLKYKGSIPIKPESDLEKFRIFIFIDEAQFLLASRAKKIVEEITSEMRKFGISIILASQSIENFNHKILKNMSTKFLMFPGDDIETRRYKQTFGIKENLVKTLLRKEGYFIFDNQNPVKRLELR